MMRFSSHVLILSISASSIQTFDLMSNDFCDETLDPDSRLAYAPLIVSYQNRFMYDQERIRVSYATWYDTYTRQKF